MFVNVFSYAFYYCRENVLILISYYEYDVYNLKSVYLTLKFAITLMCTAIFG